MCAGYISPPRLVMASCLMHAERRCVVVRPCVVLALFGIGGCGVEVLTTWWLSQCLERRLLPHDGLVRAAADRARVVAQSKRCRETEPVALKQKAQVLPRRSVEAGGAEEKRVRRPPCCREQRRVRPPGDLDRRQIICHVIGRSLIDMGHVPLTMSVVVVEHTKLQSLWLSTHSADHGTFGGRKSSGQ